MIQLLHGHATFRREYVVGARDFLAQLASTHQSPAALYVGCADSRVVPELLTTSAPGELFVIRNVANAVPPLQHRDASVGAAIDYALGHLHVEHIVVCGHYRCGGVRAVLDGIDALAAYPSLHEWLGQLQDPIDAARVQYLDAEEQWRHAVEANVVAQLANLSTYAIVRERLQAGNAQLHGWVYDLDSGSLSVFDALGERFVDASRML